MNEERLFVVKQLQGHYFLIFLVIFFPSADEMPANCYLNYMGNILTLKIKIPINYHETRKAATL